VTDNSTHHPSARFGVEGLPLCNLYRTPRLTDTTRPGEVTIELGRTPSGLRVLLTATSVEWCELLEDAARAARTRGIIRAGMEPAVTR
jgi:hypothetical protein